MDAIAWLESVDRNDLPRVGGKAANLGEMARAGLPVPPGFVVLVDGYRAHLEAGGLPERIQARLAGLSADDLPALEAASADIHRWIVGNSLPEAIATEVSRAYASLAAKMPGGASEPAVAVRSSATAEDLPDASFAGQQETFLNVRGAADVLERVKDCWASLWAPRALAYRMRMGYAHEGVHLAVVVQALVPADVAGVMFTANPMSGNREEMVITANWGLGESVVGGIATPDSFTVRPDGRVQERTLGAKEQRVVPTAEGTRTEDTPPADRGRLCLTDADLAQLAALGRRVTEHYGAPQDTEWALQGGRVFLLQARPITTLESRDSPRPPAPKLPQHVIDSLVDHFPEPVKPLDFDMMQIAFASISGVLDAVGMRREAPGDPVTELPDGTMTILPARPQPTVRALWRLPARLQWARAADPAALWGEIKRPLEASIAALSARPVEGASASELVGIIEEAFEALETHMPPRFQLLVPMAVRTALLKAWLVRAVGRDAVESVFQELMLDLPYRTSLMNRALARLAAAAARHGKDHPTFTEALAAFLAEWGSRPTRGMAPVPGFPNWSEDSTMVLGLIDALLGDAGARDADAEDERQRKAFAAAKERVSSRLLAWERPHFERAVGLARDALVVREDGLYLFERLAGIIRRATRALGPNLTDAGHLQRPDDVFFLRRSELPEAAAGRLDVRPRIARRKRAFERISRAHQGGEHWFFASGSAARPPETRKASQAGVLVAGVGASRGRVRGVVRVVQGPHEFGKVQKGDILVAKFTAPAWTPLFSLAAAVVTDIGGALSHAAIVAREYGIPAVLGTGNATATLAEGQRVVVDGTEGWVKADEESPAR